MIKEGEDITIFATGSMVYYSIQAANILEEKGLSLSVVDVHTIKPIDTDMLLKCVLRKCLFLLKSIILSGGLGTAISEFSASNGNLPPLFV